MRAAAIALIALLASPAFAQEGMYVGLGLGSFDFKENGAFLAPGPFDGTASSWKLYGGFEFNDHFGMEIRYGATEKIAQPFSGTDPTLGDFSSTFSTDFKTTSAVAMGVLPKDWGALIGGIGYFNTDEGVDLALTAECCGATTGGTSIGDDGLMAVLGIEWRFGRFGTGYGVRVEYEWLDISGASAATLGIGVSYRF